MRWTKDVINYLKPFNSSESIVNVDSTESQASPRTNVKRDCSSTDMSTGESITSGIKSRTNLEKPNSKKQSKVKVTGNVFAEGSGNQTLPGTKWFLFLRRDNNPTEVRNEHRDIYLRIILKQTWHK